MYAIATILSLIAACRCVEPGRANPSFELSATQARQILAQMRSHPRPLERPLIVLGGYADFGFGPAALLTMYAGVFDAPGDRIIVVNFGECTTFEQCRDKVIKAVDRALPTGDPYFTREVDVIGISMGGLVARVAAETGGRRLKIARLFALGSPLRGAKLAAARPVLSPLQFDMRAGSALLAAIEQHAPEHAVFPYTHLDDAVVGEELCAPFGQTPLWLDTLPLHGSHWSIAIDPRVLADIARRLRGEPPVARYPPTPLPARR
jgi:hypothetical protein